MTRDTQINVDNSVITNYLYSTILPDATDGEAEFEYDKNCQAYFESQDVHIVAGGKAVGEFKNLCERRKNLYQDIVDFIETTGKNIFEYTLDWGDNRGNPNDPSHLRKGVKMNMHMYETRAEQLSVIRRCIQQIGECKDVILSSGLDETFDQYHDEPVRDEINTRLDIDHDAEILVDAAYISKEHGVSILAAVDSDITADGHEPIFLELMRGEIADDIDVTIIDPQETPLSTLHN